MAGPPQEKEPGRLGWGGGGGLPGSKACSTEGVQANHGSNFCLAEAMDVTDGRTQAHLPIAHKGITLETAGPIETRGVTLRQNTKRILSPTQDPFLLCAWGNGLWKLAVGHWGQPGQRAPKHSTPSSRSAALKRRGNCRPRSLDSAAGPARGGGAEGGPGHNSFAPPALVSCPVGLLQDARGVSSAGSNPRALWGLAGAPALLCSVKLE